MKPIDSSFHHTIQFLFKQLKGHRLQITLNIIIGVLFVFIDLGFVWVTKLAVDIATHNSHVATLQQAFILMASIMLLRILLSICSRWIRAVLGVKAQNNMRIHLFARLLNSKWNAVRNFHTGNLTNRIEKDVTDVVNFITESIPSLVTTIVQFLGAFFFYTSIGAGLHYGLHQRKSYINQIKHPSNSMWQGSTYKKIASTYKKLRLSKYHLKSLSIPIL